MVMAAVRSDPIAALVAACGADAVTVDRDACTFFASDIDAVGKTPLAVVRPMTREAAAAAIAAATSHGLAVFPRGGGMSYTDGYLPQTEASIVLDTSALDRIVHIDPRGLWVKVEAGCTWAKLDAALAPFGVRSAFWGPFSGHDATVGGSMSNGTITFGSTAVGASGSNVLGFEVALADGRIVRTGMDARAGFAPFLAPYGPTLTQAFTGDCGALGIKLLVTLPLVPRRAHVGGLSFVFPDFAGALAALEAVARDGLATEALAVDPVIANAFGAPNLAADLKMLAQIGRGPGGIGRMIRAATGGRRFLKKPGFHAHFIAEGRDARDLAGKLGAIRALTAAGAEIPKTVPSAFRAVPFAPLTATDPQGRCVLPIHGVIPYAEAGAVHIEIGAIIAKHRAASAAAQLVVALTFFAVGRNAFLYEPVFYWPDTLTPYQEAKTTAAARHPANHEGRVLVDTMRAEMIALFEAHGAAHFGIGRRYPFAKDRDLTLLRALKREVDPRNLINPGVLGL